MTRIVAGSAKGKTLRVPKSGTRPTSEKVREAMFSSLENRGFIRGCQIVDLFSGSGALGLEAKSRGAESVVCVEAARPAAEIIRENALAARLDVSVVAMKAETWVAQERERIATAPGVGTNTEPEQEQMGYDVVFMDPPYIYGEPKLAQLLVAMAEILAPDGIAVVERDHKSPQPLWPEGWELIGDKTYGDTRVWTAGPTLENS